MAPFTGQADCNVDAKLRLAIPSKFRAVAEAATTTDATPRETDGQPAENDQSRGDKRTVWYCLPSRKGGLLKLYPEERFTDLASRRESSLTPDDPERDEQETALFGFAERLETDSAGRVKLQKWHIDMIELPAGVTVVGRNDHLQVYGREAWAALRSALEQRLP